MSILGPRLKAYRFNNNLTAKETAKILGCGLATINHIETGRQNLTETLFLKVLRLVDPMAVISLEVEKEQSEKVIKDIPKNWIPNKARNGWTNGTWGLKKYGIGFKKMKDFKEWKKQQKGLNVNEK